MLFQACSGLQVSPHKSTLFEINLVEDFDSIISTWSCQKGTLPTCYLGLPLGAKFKCRSSWDPVLERMQARLAMWKRAYLSKEGRRILLISTLSSLPVYMLSAVLLPSTVAKEMEKIMGRFLWGTTEGKKKYHLLSWDLVCLPKEMGGLGLKRIGEFNVALLTKWLWRLQEESLWVRVVKEKYGLTRGGYFPCMPKGTIGCSYWKGLNKVLQLFKRLTRFNVAVNSKKSFWEDVWCGQMPLQKCYPNAYQCCWSKGGLIKDFVRAEDRDAFSWDLHLHRRLSDRCIEEVTSLLQTLEQVRFCNSSEECLCWNDGDTAFTVKICYLKILQFRLVFSPRQIPRRNWSAIWDSSFPGRVNFFFWVLCYNRCLTQAALKRRGIYLAEKCSMCGSAGEDQSHLFFTCSLAQELWSFFLGRTVGSLNLSCIEKWNQQRNDLSSIGKVYWNLVGRATLWVIWQERNLRVFEGVSRGTQRLLQEIKYCIWNWAAGFIRVRHVRVEDLMFSWDSLVHVQ